MKDGKHLINFVADFVSQKISYEQKIKKTVFLVQGDSDSGIF